MCPIKTNQEKIDANLVIIGSGGGGMAAAVAAAEKGIKGIIVLEKRSALGGNASMVEGIFAAESIPQKRVGIDASRDVLFRLLIDYTHWRVNPRLIRAVINKSADTIQWLADKGVKLEYVSREFLKQPIPTFHTIPGKRAGAVAIKAFMNECETSGVQILRETAGKKLKTDRTGKITGVIAENKSGQLNISTENVIIATGGYAGNADLIKKYWPDFRPDRIHVSGGTLYTGDGLLMAIEIGAADDARGALHMGGPDFQGVKNSMQVAAISHEPITVWVNKKGERWVDESHDVLAETANALHRQLDGVSFSLFDESIKQTICTEGTIKAGIPGMFADRGSTLPNLDKELKIEENSGTVKISNSWNEIAEWIGVSPERLMQEINEYNRFCDQGYDAIFNKDRRYLKPLRTPPYYATRCGGFMGITHGAIKINHNMEVLDKSDNPIPGLYAIGNDAGGWQYDTYSIVFSGFACGFAFNAGRIAAENIANKLG